MGNVIKAKQRMRTQNFVSDPPGSSRAGSSNPRFSLESDWTQHSDDQHVVTRFRMNRGLTDEIRQANNSAAQWRLRVQARKNKFAKLKELGTLAVISTGSLLHYTKNPSQVTDYQSYSRWKETLVESDLYKAVRPDRRGTLVRAPKPRYERLEAAIRSLGQMICLAVENLEDHDLIRSFCTYKVWSIEVGMSAPLQDSWMESLKWLGKTCQALFLNSEMPLIENFQILEKDGILFPFDGQLKFISDLYYGRRDRNLGLSLEESRALAQVGSVVRALPYPSHEQVTNSVAKTISIIGEKANVPSRRILKKHSESLRWFIREFKSKSEMRKTHLSLANSACFERARGEGGRADYLVELSHKATNVALTDQILIDLSGKVDCFGQQIINPVCALLAREYFKENPYAKGTLGDILYCDVSELYELLNQRQSGEEVVPRNLARILVNIATCDMLKFGHYDNNPLVMYNLLTFDKSLKNRISKFHMTESSIPVRASLSIEAGLKTRLVTSAPAAITLLGQLIGHYTRETLSNDAFMRTGFEESEKLWEVLKTYAKYYNRLELLRRRN